MTVGTTYYVRYGNAAFNATFTVCATSSTSLSIAGLRLFGSRTDTVNRLQWETASPSYSDGFDLQRSSDGQTFRSIALIPVTTTARSSQSAAYHFDDTGGGRGNVCHRLKQTDRSGAETLSNTVRMENDEASGAMLHTIYPSPAMANVTVALHSPESDVFNITITDIAGQVVIQQPSFVSAGYNVIPVNVENLASGVYLLKVTCGHGCDALFQKFIKH